MWLLFNSDKLIEFVIEEYHFTSNCILFVNSCLHCHSNNIRLVTSGSHFATPTKQLKSCNYLVFVSELL